MTCSFKLSTNPSKGSNAILFSHLCIFPPCFYPSTKKFLQWFKTCCFDDGYKVPEGERIRGIVAWLRQTSCFPKNCKRKQLKGVQNLSSSLELLLWNYKALIGSSEWTTPRSFIKCWFLVALIFVFSIVSIYSKELL